MGKNRVMKAFWHQSDNFGDKLTPWILSKLGIKVEYVDRFHSEPHLIGCGSIITAANELSIIWGSGIAQPWDQKKPKKILAVRGIETAEWLQKKNISTEESILCDPAYLLPEFIKPSYKKRGVGIVHHMIDFNGVGHDVTAEIETTVDYITSSEKIETSSLHVAIAAAAYKIPYKKIISDRVIGQQWKFKDFEESKHLYNPEALKQSIYEVEL